MTMHEGEQERERERVVPHMVELPLASECEHREIIYYHATSKLGNPFAIVEPVHLKKCVQVVDLGDVWRLTKLRRVSRNGPVPANFDLATECEAALYAYETLERFLKQIERDEKAKKTLTMLQREIRKGKADLHLHPRNGSDLSRCWALMEREWVRLPVVVWRDEEGKCW